MNELIEHKEQIRQELGNCRTLYEVYRISHGLKQVYPDQLVEEEKKRRQLELDSKRRK